MSVQSTNTEQEKRREEKRKFGFVTGRREEL